MSDAFVEITPSIANNNSQAALRDEVLRRIEVYVLELLYALLTPLNQKADSNAAFYGRGFNTQQPFPVLMRPENSVQCRTRRESSTQFSLLLTAKSTLHNLRSLHTTRQHLLLLRLLYANVQQGTVQTHRDVYYNLVREVPSQVMVNRTVQQLARVLRVPRELLGVTAGGRGYIAGAIFYRGTSLESPTLAREGMPLPLLDADLTVTLVSHCDEEEGPVEYKLQHEGVARNTGAFGCAMSSLRPNSSSIHSAAMSDVLSPDETSDAPSYDPAGFQIESNVRFILVVEKHAVFTYLLREGLPRLVPCVLLTAQGFPTHAAHRLLANLHAAVPSAAVVGLVDYNPHGLAILAAYRWPSSVVKVASTTRSSVPSTTTPCAPSVDVMLMRPGAMPENRFCAVPAMRWLAVRSSHVRHLRSYVNAQGREGTTAVEKAGCNRSGESVDVTTEKRRDAAEVRRNYTRSRNNAARAKASLNGRGSLNKEVLRVSCCLPAETADAKRSRAEISTASNTSDKFFPSKPPLAMPASMNDLQTPMQPFTQRDVAVLDNLVRQLEARLRFLSATAITRKTPILLDDGTPSIGRHPRTNSVFRTRAGKATKVFDTQDQQSEVPHVDVGSDNRSTAAWLREAKAMHAGAAKCELEVLYTRPYSAWFCGTLLWDQQQASSDAAGSENITEGSKEIAVRAPSNFAHWVAQQLLRGHYV